LKSAAPGYERKSRREERKTIEFIWKKEVVDWFAGEGSYYQRREEANVSFLSIRSEGGEAIDQRIVYLWSKKLHRKDPSLCAIDLGKRTVQQNKGMAKERGGRERTELFHSFWRRGK